MTIVQIFDNGAIFGSEMLDIDEQTLIDQFLASVKTVAAISLAVNFPTLVSVSHSLVNAYKVRFRVPFSLFSPVRFSFAAADLALFPLFPSHRTSSPSPSLLSSPSRDPRR